MGRAAGAGCKSRLGDMAYRNLVTLNIQPNFRSFDYVNPNAPKGGAASQAVLGTYDNFNMVVAGIKGTLALGIDFVYDTLLVPALDEVSSVYGLIAEAYQLS